MVSPKVRKTSDKICMATAQQQIHSVQKHFTQQSTKKVPTNDNPRQTKNNQHVDASYINQ